MYTDIINPYPPLLPYFLLFYFQLFGLSLVALKFITFLIIVLVDLLLVFTVRKIFNQNLALLSLGVFVLLQPVLEGNGLWFDLFITPFLLVSLYLLNQ
ncbi:MAG: glycosyltransferase family 39 protein, partial [Candidatus Omnitrophica bacterium]|nr:glycosyltransferase family 39 protein [Candidatus Omnitrophota bacterium]